MTSFALLLLYVLVVTLPLGVSWIFGGPPRPFWAELGSGLGMLAFSMILVEFVLSGRFRRVSSGIGMDVTMRFHQVMARAALLFALLHPFFYGGSAVGGPRPWDPTRVLTVSTDLTAMAGGILAFVLLPALVALAVYRSDLDYKYETWRLMHGIGAVLIAGALLHHALSAGRYSAEAEMVWLWAAMVAAAIGSLIWVYLIEPARARPWRVTEIKRLTPRQWSVTVTPEGHAGLDYKAGQFAWLNIGHSAYSLHENPFSISSAPDAGADVSFVIKELGDFTGALDQVAPGTRAYLDAPYGSLTVEGRDEPGIALIAGGVGIAPMLGILRQLRLTGDPRKLRIIYGNRAEEQIVFREELAAEDTVLVLSEPPKGWAGEHGMVDGDLLDRCFTEEEIRSWLFVLCGPPAMMDAVEDHLIARGGASDRILSERFDYG
ncbi:ferredoxin reductase family protein [Phaeobacter sp. PT47_59]|uniref:ferredoxin reductase family protein n=1 Tax=Phaeobacter sp. PT47_59 TaxID=3029979 RepID=UPI002380A552|nr:ferredoxin reductase family protein [Phaeobacter sp. PT47_59]MDE4173453.1 ferredoxin reductase family protein [Phaeobacter sp. PT47_59]